MLKTKAVSSLTASSGRQRLPEPERTTSSCPALSRQFLRDDPETHPAPQSPAASSHTPGLLLGLGNENGIFSFFFTLEHFFFFFCQSVWKILSAFFYAVSVQLVQEGQTHLSKMRILPSLPERHACRAPSHRVLGLCTDPSLHPLLCECFTFLPTLARVTFLKLRNSCVTPT